MAKVISQTTDGKTLTVTITRDELARSAFDHDQWLQVGKIEPGDSLDFRALYWPHRTLITKGATQPRDPWGQPDGEGG